MSVRAIHAWTVAPAETALAATNALASPATPASTVNCVSQMYLITLNKRCSLRVCGIFRETMQTQTCELNEFKSSNYDVKVEANFKFNIHVSPFKCV